ncbi:MAG: YfhO family protein [Bacteroidota bacterium]
MLKTLFAKNWPHLVAVLLFVSLGLAYFSPVTQGKVLQTHDKTQWKGMAKETVDYRLIEGEEPLWTNSMFGGMPTFMISTLHPSNLFKTVHKVLSLGLPHPVGTVFLYMLGFYVLLLVMRVDPWLAILGAIAFAFSSYYFVILDAGHNSKATAIAYMAPILAGVILTLRGKYVWGALVTAFFLALEISANHLQITYYFGMAITIFMLAHLIEAIREKTLPSYFKSAGILLCAAGVAVLCNMSAIWTSLEYSDYTTRGKTELTIKADGSSNEDIRTDGLDKKYVTDWSYGIEETLTFIVPNAKGGATATIGSVDKSLAKKADRQFRQNIEGSNHYWGNQSITSGPVYMGVIVFYLFIVGLFFRKGYLRWAVLAIFLLTVMLGWGRNFMGFTEFFLDYFPGYNKFRAVTIILSITSFVVPLLGVLGLKYVIDNRDRFKANLKPWYIVSGIFALFMLVLAFFPDSFLDFISDAERKSFLKQIEDFPEQTELVEEYSLALKDVRIAIFKSDALARLGLLLISIATLFAFLKQKINATVLIAILGVLILGDLWSVDKRYINNSKRTNGQKRWVKADKANKDLEPTRADLIILGAKQNEIQNFSELVAEYSKEFKESKGIKKLSDGQKNAASMAVLNANTDYRVLNLSNPFNESRTSYFHKSLGGYHGAKLKRYQELTEFHLANPDGQGDVQKAFASIQSNPSVSALNEPVEPLHILNMLNTEFVVYDARNDQVPPFPNPNAYGNAWMVENVNWVENSDQEITDLGQIDPSITALVDERYRGKISGDGGSGSVVLDSYKPNHLTYSANVEKAGLVIFSEIFYDAGWQAYIDDNPVDHVRANYVLRALDIPEGEHKVEFIFEPKSYYTGSTISLIFSALVILGMIWLIVQFFRKPLQEVET